MAIHIDPAWLALIGTIFGGVGLKLVEQWLGRKQVRISDAAGIRNELRLEITALRSEVDELEDERERWRRDYYDLRDKYIRLETRLAMLRKDLTDDGQEPSN